MTENRDQRDYEVGYGKPPKRTRFPKGKSGNPKGRPRKKKQPFEGTPNPFRDAVFEELARPVRIKEGEATTELTALKAVLRSLLVEGIKGNRLAAKEALKIARMAEETRLSELDARIAAVERYKHLSILPSLNKPSLSLARLPHPDHIDIDPFTCELLITGPVTRDEAKAWDDLKENLLKHEELLHRFRAEAASNPSCEVHMKNLRVWEEAMDRLLGMVPPGWNWREELRRV